MFKDSGSPTLPCLRHDSPTPTPKWDFAWRYDQNGAADGSEDEEVV